MRITPPSAAHSVESALAEQAQNAERAADWESAFASYQRLFWAALEREDLEAAADALRGQSRICQQRKKFTEAEEFAQLSFELAKSSGCSRAAARAINTLAVISFLQHDSETAGRLYGEALACATDCGDDALIGWTCQNLGVLASLRGDLREARALYLESVASSVRSGDITTAVTAYNNLGMISADLEEWTDSVLYFDRGLELAEELGDVGVHATLLSNRAEPLIHVGELDRAALTLRRAEGFASEIGDLRTISEISRFRGVMARIQHRHGEAETYLTQALSTAELGALPLEKAEATEELARLRWQEERRGPARMLGREALRAYEDLHAEQNATRLRELLREWTGYSAGEIAG